MVKSKPRIPDRSSRKRHRLDSKLTSLHRHLLKLASFSPSPQLENPKPETLDKPPVTPSSLSMRRRIKFMKRTNKSISPSSFSLSLSPSISCSSSSSSPPLPPHPSPELLRRTVSDTSMLPKRSPSSSSSRPVSRNLMGQLTPLPPSSSSPLNVLRRTISDPVHLQTPTSKEENEKGKTESKAVEAEKLSGEWIVVKFNCECGKDGHYLVNAADKKYFKLA